MKLLLLLLLLKLPFVFSAEGAMKTDRVQAKLRGPVHIMVSMACEEDGSITPFLEEYTSMTTYDRQGMEINQGENWVWNYEYDSKNRLEKRTLVRVGGHASQIEKYTYRKEGQVTVVEINFNRRIYYGGLGPDTITTTTNFSGVKGQLLEKIEVMMSPISRWHTLYTYYENGDLHEKINSNPDGLLDTKEVHTYEEIENGRRIERSLYDPKSKLLRRDLMEYDPYGNPTGYTKLKAPPQAKTGFGGLYVYEYDTEGNWTKRLNYPDTPPHKEPHSITCRNITYYQEEFDG